MRYTGMRIAERYLPSNAPEAHTMYRLIALIFISFPLTAQSVDCAGLLQQHLRTDLDLSYEQFDQTMDSGFRPLAKLGCAKEAAELIGRYISKNGAEQSSLRWHMAQLLATAGDYDSAIPSARMTLREGEDFAQHPLRWNDYVLATIAFMEGDKEALLRHRENVAQGASDYFGNELNLKLLDSLVKNFGESYEYATTHIE